MFPNELGSLDVIFGNNDLKATEAEIDFANSKISFKKGYKTCFRMATETTVKPKQARCVRLYGKVPKPFKHRDMIIKSSGMGLKVMSDRSLVSIDNNRCYAMVMNETNKPIKISKGTIMAHIDVDTSFEARYHVKEGSRAIDVSATLPTCEI